MAFSEPPTGVKVAKMIVTSAGSSAELKWLRLRLDNEGCNPDEGKIKFHRKVSSIEVHETLL